MIDSRKAPSPDGAFSLSPSSPRPSDPRPTDPLSGPTAPCGLKINLNLQGAHHERLDQAQRRIQPLGRWRLRTFLRRTSRYLKPPISRGLFRFQRTHADCSGMANRMRRHRRAPDRRSGKTVLIQTHRRQTPHSLTHRPYTFSALKNSAHRQVSKRQPLLSPMVENYATNPERYPPPSSRRRINVLGRWSCSGLQRVSSSYTDRIRRLAPE